MKKIKSESKFPDESFKIKIGTMDKKNPEVIYIELGSYISPTEEKKTYKQNVLNIERETKALVGNVIENSGLCKSDFIFVSDIADERIAVNKKSYFELQLFVKPLDSVRTSGKFYELTEKFNDECVSKIIPQVKQYITENGFEYYKSRK
jgi:hypothetical protein